MSNRILSWVLIAAVAVWGLLAFALPDLNAEPLLRVSVPSVEAALWLLVGVILLGTLVIWMLQRPDLARKRQAQDIALSNYVADGVIHCTLNGRVHWHNSAAADWVRSGKLIPQLTPLLEKVRKSRRLTMRSMAPDQQGRYTIQVLPVQPRDVVLILRPMQQQGQDSTLYDNFIRRIVHDMRNPLAGIIGHAANLAHALPSDSVQDREHWVRSAATIEHEAQRLARLVDSMLFDARLAYVPLDMQQFDLLDVVEEAVFAMEENAARQDKTLAIDAPRQPMPFDGDRDLLLRALENLIDNSIKYTQAGSEIQVSLDAHTNAYLLRVQDDGEGIAPDFLPDRIFEPLVRARSGGEGSGLGLAIVKKIVAMHHGQIHATSTLGQGTTMTITLTRQEATP